jgi:hypothetical protein
VTVTINCSVALLNLHFPFINTTFISVLLPLLPHPLHNMSAEPTTAAPAATTAPAATENEGDALDKGVAFVSGKAGHKLVITPPAESFLPLIKHFLGPQDD